MYKCLKAVILDWAGTAVDFGSRAPVMALEQTFCRVGIDLAAEEARRDMGLLKKDHIRAIVAQPRVRRMWAELRGSEPTEADVELLFEKFLPEQTSVLRDSSDVIPGVAEAVGRWRSGGLRVGSSTGYTRELLAIVEEKAAEQGYVPDASITPDLVGAGRPAPLMMYRNALDLRVWPLWACVKIGDTPVDIEEGLNAGAWTIGITDTGNEIGLSEEELRSLTPEERGRRSGLARDALLAAGAHFTAPSAAECDALLDEIDALLAAGQRPWEPRR